MRTEVILADTIDAAVEQILHELREDTSTRSIRNRENAIYFDGWDGLGASAVLRAVAHRLTAMASSDEAPAGLQFDQIIYIDCSKWESRRALQRVILEQLELPTEALDRQDEDDDFHGVAQGSRNEIPEVLDATYQHILTLRRRFLVIFQNGSSEEIDFIFTTFGFPMYGYSRNKLLWTFQGSLRLYPRMKVDRVLKSTATTDIFLSASRRDQDPLELWRYLVRQEAAQVARRNAAGAGSLLDQPALISECFFYTLKQCCMGSQCMMDYDFNIHCGNYWMCDGIIHLRRQGEGGNRADDDDDDDCGPWRVADALQREMRLDVDYRPQPHGRQYFPSHMVKRAKIIPCWTSSYRITQILDDGTIANGGIFQHYDKLCVLKLSCCSFSFSSLPFLCCRSLRFLWLDHCQDSNQVISKVEASAEETEIRSCFQRLWVLDVRYTPCEYWILSPQIMDLMTQLRELNVMGAQDWDIGHLHGRLPNIRNLRVTKSIVRCSHHSKQDLFSGMNKLGLLDFSGNRTMQGVTGFSEISTSNSCLETLVVIDGCVGIQKFSFRESAKLKNLVLSGLFEDLLTLDLSGTAVKTLDLSAMTADRLDEVILDNCDKLCAILWPPEGKRKSYLQEVHIDTTQSASTSRSREEKMQGGSKAANTGSSSSWPMALVNGARPPSEFYWYISIKDARLLRSFVPTFEKYFEDRKVHLEISSPSCCPAVHVGGSKNEEIKTGTGEEPRVLSHRRRRQQPQYYNNNASMYYADVATVIVEEHLLQGGEEGNGNEDAPTITRTRPCPSPVLRLDSSDSYLHTQDQQMTAKAGTDGGASIATIPSSIRDSAFILHVHDSLYNTSIPGPAHHDYTWWNYLLWCRVERCPRLEFFFTAPQLLVGGGSSRVRMCWSLKTFWASQLPRARFMWDTSKLPLSQIENSSFEDLTLLHLDFCPRLIHVLPSSLSIINRRYLETIEIVWCGDLRVVFPLLDTNTESHQEQQQQKPPGAIITMVHFPNLKHIHLHELPMLGSICGLGRMYAPDLETIKIRGCWSLRHLPAVSSDRSNNKVECDCEKEWWDRLEWDGLGGMHHPSLYRPLHSRYYKKKLLRGSVLI